MDRLAAMKAFVRVLEKGSFSAAAKQMKYRSACCFKVSLATGKPARRTTVDALDATPCADGSRTELL